MEKPVGELPKARHISAELKFDTKAFLLPKTFFFEVYSMSIFINTIVHKSGPAKVGVWQCPCCVLHTIHILLPGSSRIPLASNCRISSLKCFIMP